MENAHHIFRHRNHPPDYNIRILNHGFKKLWARLEGLIDEKEYESQSRRIAAPSTSRQHESKSHEHKLVLLVAL